MDLEKLFYKWYKKISWDTPKEQIEERWEGIENAVEYSWNEEDISELIKLYYKLPYQMETKTKFVEFFSDIDKGFDESNDEEISVLVGSVLTHLLQREHEAFIAFSLQVLEPYFENNLMELAELAADKIGTMSKDSYVNMPEIEELKKFSSDWETELADDGQLSENAAIVLIDIIKQLQTNLEIVCSRNEVLQEENEQFREKTQILSWIVGEWSDILKVPLAEVFDINASIVLGVELADLVRIYPGPYAAEAFLVKMLSKCKKNEKGSSLISLTDLVDRQEVAIKEEILKKYGKNCETRILPILSALKASLSVDDKREWIPIYKKAWKINPDDIKLKLSDWTRLVYQECMISNY